MRQFSYIGALALLPFLTAAATTAKKACAITLDGRVPSTSNGTDFDAGTLPYNPGYVLGENQKWSNVLQFPQTASLFDASTKTKAVEVTISDGSIFAPSPDNRQTGFRRSELLLAGNPAVVSGKKTLHFSVQFDAARPLNYSHEYQLVFIESADYSTNQVVLKTGTLIGEDGKKSKRLLLQGNVADAPVKTLFEKDLKEGVWYNFGLVLDFDSNTVQVYFSTAKNKLVSQGAPVSNDLSGQGEWHFGVLKKPTGNVADVTKQGYQESGINEGVIFGGIFFEDSSSGCVSVSGKP